MGINLMEICGTHTMAAAKAGIRGLLPKGVRLVSGPGCPVCVTPAEVIDSVLELSKRKDILITSFGDMIRVPGSQRGESLRSRMAEGANVRIVYSPPDAVRIAKENPEKEVVFLGVGFETTAPGIALAVGDAFEAGLQNFSVFTMLKTCEPAVRALAKDPEFNIQGFICPGHVAVIIGEEGFYYMPRDLKLPGVIAGFEGADVVKAVAMLLRQIEKGEAKIENEYSRVVKREGNKKAKDILEKYFEPCDSLWRGMGKIEKSGLALKKEYEAFDAAKRFSVTLPEKEKETSCRCGDVIRGKLSPEGCPLFGKSCFPEDPVGPCMVSSEGACAAEWKYGKVE